MEGNGKKYKCCFCGKEYDTEYKDSFFVRELNGAVHKISFLQMQVWNDVTQSYEQRKLRACTNCLKAFMNGYLYCGSQNNMDINIQTELAVEDEIIDENKYKK